MKLVGFIRFPDTRDQLFQTGESPAINFKQILFGNAVCGRVKIVNVAENVTGCIADASIGLGDLLEDCVADTGVVAIVLGGDPEAQNFSTVLLDDFLRGNHITHRLGHRSTLLVEDKTMGQNCFVWGGVTGPDCCQQA